MAQIIDDWEVAVDTGEFDKQFEQQEKDRAAKQVRFHRNKSSFRIHHSRLGIHL